MFMLFLSTTTQQPDYVALAMVLALAVVVAVMALRKRAKNNSPMEATQAAPVAQPQADAPEAPGSAGQLKLHDVAPKTAAMLMAIVADKTGKPLNELRFISIKEVK